MRLTFLEQDGGDGVVPVPNAEADGSRFMQIPRHAEAGRLGLESWMATEVLYRGSFRLLSPARAPGLRGRAAKARPDSGQLDEAGLVDPGMEATLARENGELCQKLERNAGVADLDRVLPAASPESQGQVAEAPVLAEGRELVVHGSNRTARA